MKLNEWLSAKKLSDNAVYSEPVVVEKGETVHLIAPAGKKDARVLMKPVQRMLKTPEDYRDLLAGSKASMAMVPDGVRGCDVDGVKGKDAKALSQARTEAVEFVYGKDKISDQARAEIVKRYFPLRVSLAAVQDITINTGATFVIDGGVGSYHFGTVTIHQGGYFVVHSNADITIDALVKAPAN